MLYSTWTPAALLSEARGWRGKVWRIVESQHIAATLKLVDTLAEQDLLEQLLEFSKPNQPPSTDKLDYLLATPFRYHPSRTGSRFRSITDAGVFYGALSIKTAAAELGYWRWRFLKEAVALHRLDPVPHTSFQAAVFATSLDLRNPPFNQEQATWEDPTNYGPTQLFAKTARAAQVEAIIYQSVRDKANGTCLALLTPAGFASARPISQQTWFLAVSQHGVIWKDNQSNVFEFNFSCQA